MRTLSLLGVAAAAALFGTAPGDAQPGSADALNAQSAPAPATTTTVISADPGMPAAVVTDIPGNASSVPPAEMKNYPVCSATRQDSCQNRGEGGAPGRSRALRHWPGHPASEGAR